MPELERAAKNSKIEIGGDKRGLDFCFSHNQVLIREIVYESAVESNAYHPIENAAGIEMELLQVGSEPVGMRCPFCYEDVMTKAHYKNSKLTHIIALILGIFFWWLCCCILPYITNRWKNVEHYCPNCRRYLGLYTRRSAILL